MTRKAYDFTGQTFGKLYVLSFADKDRHGHTRWNCICECGREVKVIGAQLKSGNTKTCGCSRHTINSKHPNFRGHKEISGKLWNSWRRIAEKRPVAFEITIEYAWNLYLEQERLCNLSKLPIHFAESSFKNEHGERTASLDRIDNTLGYIEGNIQWVHKWVNLMKSDHTQDEFIDFCKAVARNN